MNLDFELARRNMTHQQVRCWDVLDENVINVLGRIPREHFVPAQYASLAFADTCLPIEGSPGFRTGLSPQLEGRILQALKVQSADRILVVGTGSGFLTACLARLGRHVTSVDSAENVIAAARQNLDAIGITNVDLQTQNVFEQGLSQTFDAIAITGSLSQYDQQIDSWLNAGGRAFVVIGTSPVMEARLIRRLKDGSVEVESLFETDIAPLPNVNSGPEFEF